MMGDGVVDLHAFRRSIEAAGYTNPQEVEIFSAEHWWKEDGDVVLETCKERYLAHCQVEMA
jgi:sugar phosphate isomerase/epimerase